MTPSKRPLMALPSADPLSAPVGAFRSKAGPIGTIVSVDVIVRHVVVALDVIEIHGLGYAIVLV
jgi:hypothetical protein